MRVIIGLQMRLLSTSLRGPNPAFTQPMAVRLRRSTRPNIRPITGFFLLLCGFHLYSLICFATGNGPTRWPRIQQGAAIVHPLRLASITRYSIARPRGPPPAAALQRGPKRPLMATFTSSDGELLMSRHLPHTLMLSDSYRSRVHLRCARPLFYGRAPLSSRHACHRRPLRPPRAIWISRTVASSKTADVPPASQLDIGIDFSKQITGELGGSRFQPGLDLPRQPDERAHSDANSAISETVFQYQILKDRRSRLAIVFGLVVDWGRTRGPTQSASQPIHADNADALFRERLWRSAFKLWLNHVFSP